MEPVAWIALFAAASVNAAMPGPCMALTVSRSARGGLRSGLAVSLGVVLACLVLLLIAIGVMAGMVMISPQAYSLMRLAGCAVLLAMAAAMIFGGGAGRVPGPRQSDRGAAGCIAGGAIVGLSSPYNLIFLLALLPQYIPADSLTVPAAAGIAAAVLAGTLAVQSGVALLACCSRGIGSGRSARLIELACAGCLVFFAGAAFAA